MTTSRSVPWIKILIANLLILFSTGAWALGAGDITLHSTLGQPLKAEITLHNAGDLNREQIIVRNAPPEAYEELGVERSYTTQVINYAVKDTRTVTLKTRDPVNEPFLNFVVEFVWPEGRIFREYRVFLDPI